ncbi:hypothetical protein [Dyella mobilis]|uniref:Uncharacterized protein n=1 Tax=Dyella mobilis TaxID=1849582 RepID=A0ABS2KC04_9GAMM|nr:hypothetical protein [Dyella mobilis]MBM7128716.1 hypothetical protein [Dyella mobilis]
MACPSDLKPNILQFDAHPDAFWSAFAAKKFTSARLSTRRRGNIAKDAL